MSSLFDFTSFMRYEFWVESPFVLRRKFRQCYLKKHQTSLCSTKLTWRYVQYTQTLTQGKQCKSIHCRRCLYFCSKTVNNWCKITLYELMVCTYTWCTERNSLLKFSVLHTKKKSSNNPLALSLFCIFNSYYLLFIV